MGLCGSTTEKIDDYKSPRELMEALRNSGCLEDVELMIGVDATKSNEMTGHDTFGGNCLHALNVPGRDNPYVGVMKAATKFLERDADSNLPLYFFGSDQANRTGGISFIKEAKGQQDLIASYKAAISQQTLSGPTTFVPLIKEAMRRAKHLRKFHVCLIITDGAIQDEQQHYQILNEASRYPLAFVVVGVGDGPFGLMEKFDDHMPAGRVFDNLQFVSFSEIVKKESIDVMAEEFFFRAFMEVPAAYGYVKERLGYRMYTGGDIPPFQPPHPPFLAQQQAPVAVNQVGLSFAPSAPVMPAATSGVPPPLQHSPSYMLVQTPQGGQQLVQVLDPNVMRQQDSKQEAPPAY